MKKTNSIHFGGKMIGAGAFVGFIIPFAIWIFTRKIIVPLIIAGGVILLVFILLFIVESDRDNGKKPYYVRKMNEQFPFDPEKQYAVIRCSICTGEKVAGFRNKDDGRFTDVMVIRSNDDEQRFKTAYGLDKVKKEY